MGGRVVISSAAHSRIRHARAWLETRSPAEEILILAATADAGNELARDVARTKGAAFGWHRLSLAQFAAVLAAPLPILLSPLSHAYFDVPYAEPSADPHQEERRREVGLRVYAPKSIAETFDWDPAEALGPNAPLANLAGVGSAIWGKTIKDFTDLTFMLLPRLAGIAEKGWSDPQVSSWADHCGRLAAHGRLWSQDGLTYFKSSTVDWEPERSL